MSTKDRVRLARAKWLLGLGPALLGLLLLPVAMTSEENFGLWMLFHTRGAIAPPDDVIVIGIDEDSERILNGRIDRSSHADLVEALVRAGASIIVFDIFLHVESENDADLAEAIGEARNVILAALLERARQRGIDRQTLRTPVPALAAQAIGTAPWLIPETFSVNWVYLRDNADRSTIPLVALQAYVFDEFMRALQAVRPEVAGHFPRTRAELHPNRPLDRIMEELRDAFAADRSLAADMIEVGAANKLGLRQLIAAHARVGAHRTNRLYLNYYGTPRTIPTVPYQDALASLLRGEIDVAGKAVFIGYSAQQQPGQQDDSPYVFSTNGFNLSGVEMGATAFANLLYDSSLKAVTSPLREVIVVLWGILVPACFVRLRVRFGAAAGILLAGGYLLSALIAFRAAAVWLPMVVPGIQFLFAGALSLRVKQLGERAQLGVATSEEAALALTGRGKAEKVDHRVILFADEQGSKKRLKRALEQLDVSQRRAQQRDIAVARDVPVARRGGKINHTLADSMLAYWMTPDLKNLKDLAAQMTAACKAALAIHAEIAELNRRYPGFELSMRIGLDWGEVTSRLNPSPEIRDWKMEGAPIHTAERLESLNKVLSTSTLISHSVAKYVADKDVYCQELGTFVFCDDTGEVVVDAVRIFELSAMDGVTEETRAHAVEFQAALSALRQHEWEQALVLFEKLAASRDSHGGLAARYVAWCRQSLQEQACRWQGIVMVTFSDKSQYLDRFL